MRVTHPALCAALGLIVVGACAPAIPDSAAGVGFDNSLQAQQAREAALAGGGTSPLVPPLAVSDEPLDAAVSTGVVQHAAPVEATPLPGATGSESAAPVATAGSTVSSVSGGSVSGGSSTDIAAETAAALAATTSNSGAEPLQASPLNPAPQQISNPGISDENDFAAVSDRETIASDAQRIERNKAQYQQVAPAAIPQRAGDAQPNIVQYALATSNPVGTKVFSRAGLNLEAKAARNCAAFASPDQAQIAFLDAGGPQRDRRGLDPDGDGYACSWDPTPFRRAVQN